MTLGVQLSLRVIGYIECDESEMTIFAVVIFIVLHYICVATAADGAAEKENKEIDGAARCSFPFHSNASSSCKYCTISGLRILTGPADRNLADTADRISRSDQLCNGNSSTYDRVVLANWSRSRRCRIDGYVRHFASR
ncbi:hypothetical protein U1Q18_050870 [Sarracenia purpurea var. burkii]